MKIYNFRKNTIIGNLDAETDSFLQDCFIETEIYKTLSKFNDEIDFTKRIIIGRTGSGKTAILKKLSQDRSIKKHGIIEAESTVFEHINNNIFISNLMNNGIDLRVFYKSLWMHVLLVKSIELLYPDTETFFEKLSILPMSLSKRGNKVDTAKEYVDLYRDNFFNDNALTEITDKMQTELSATIAFQASKLSFSENEEQIIKIQRATASYVSKELLSKQKEVIKFIKDDSSNESQIRIIISIDDLDKSWLSSSEIRYDFINALLDAFKELIDIKSIKILISIRTDIIMGIYQNNLRQEEKDKSLIIPITWNKNEIRKILDKRINYLIKNQYAGREKVSLSDIFYFDVNNIRADEYIIERTMLRPRDAIDFVNYCLSEGDGSTALSEGVVLTAEQKFYTSRKQAMVKEWSSLYKNISDYLDSISFIKKQIFKNNEISIEKDKISEYLVSKIDSSQDKKSDDIALNFDSLLKVWFITGVVGIKISQDLVIYSSFDKPELDITDLNKEFFIHPLFYRV